MARPPCRVFNPRRVLRITFSTVFALVAIGAPRSLLLAEPGLGSSASTDVAEALTALRTALDQVDQLGNEVKSGKIIRNYGQQAQSLLESSVKSVGDDVKQDLERTLDGALRALFLRQLALLRFQIGRTFESDGKPSTALLRAEQQFEKRAKDLVRPGSSWSIESEKAALRANLEMALRHNVALSQEKARVAQTQRATVDVIGKLQKQMEQLGNKLRGTGAGSPYVFWTSFRLPRTPIQVSARYQQGRTNIEMNLLPQQDPANAEAGFVQSLTPQNLGLSLNIGL